MIEDAAYVRELLAILTNPHPSGISPDDPYGMADDGIDRHNGFGREVWVESVRVTDDGPWEELEVTFGLDVPDDAAFREVPSRGTLRVPIGREWRELSRYAQPSAYAPHIASAVESASRSLVTRHCLPRPEPLDLDAVRAALPAAGELWDELLTHLGWNGTAREVAPGRIEVFENDDSDPRLTLLVTPEQWADFRAGSDDWQLALDEVIGPRQDDETFLIYLDRGFGRSIREELPLVHGGVERERRIAEIRAKNPDARLGWFAWSPNDDRPDGTGAQLNGPGGPTQQ